MKALVLLILIPSIALSGDMTEEFNLKMLKKKRCGEPTFDFSTTLSMAVVDDDFNVALDIATNCATSLKNPRLHINDYGITIATDEVSESGYYTACRCRSQYEFTFRFEEFEGYQMKNLFITANGAVVGQSDIPIE